MKDKDTRPPVSVELVEYLYRLYPPRTPDEKTKFHEIWMDAGAKRVIEHLASMAEDQHDIKVELSSVRIQRTSGPSGPSDTPSPSSSPRPRSEGRVSFRH